MGGWWLQIVAWELCRLVTADCNMGGWWLQIVTWEVGDCMNVAWELCRLVTADCNVGGWWLHDCVAMWMHSYTIMHAVMITNPAPMLQPHPQSCSHQPSSHATATCTMQSPTQLPSTATCTMQSPTQLPCYSHMHNAVSNPAPMRPHVQSCSHQPSSHVSVAWLCVYGV